MWLWAVGFAVWTGGRDRRLTFIPTAPAMPGLIVLYRKGVTGLKITESFDIHTGDLDLLAGKIVRWSQEPTQRNCMGFKVLIPVDGIHVDATRITNTLQDFDYLVARSYWCIPAKQPFLRCLKQLQRDVIELQAQSALLPAQKPHRLLKVRQEGR